MKNLFHKDRQISVQQGRMVQKQAPFDFLDPAHEWRRIFAETWGTFLLVLVAGGGVVAARSGGAVTLGMQVVAPGLMVIIYFIGTVSGAHLNRAVTLAFALRRNFPWIRVPGYVLAQLFGGVAAAEFLHAMFGTVGALGATVPGSGIGNGTALAMEVVLTAGLVNDPGHGLGSAQHRNQRCHCGGRLHRVGGPMGGTDQRRLNEPGPFVRA